MYNVAIQTFVSFTYRYLESPMLINLNKKLQRLHNNVIYQSLFTFSDTFFITRSLTFYMERIYPFFSTEFYSENLVILMTVSECQRRNMDFHVDSFRLRYQGGHS